MSSDDLSSMRAEIRGSGPMGQGANRNYIDPSLEPAKIDKQSEYRLVQQSGVAGAKFFGIVSGIAGAIVALTARYIFSERFTSGPKMSAIGGAIGVALGGVFGYITGKQVMRQNIREANEAIEQGQSPRQYLPQPTTPTRPEREPVVAPAVLLQQPVAEESLPQAELPVMDPAPKELRHDVVQDAVPDKTVSDIAEHQPVHVESVEHAAEAQR